MALAKHIADMKKNSILVLDDSEEMLYLMAATIDHFCGRKVVTAKSLREIEELGKVAVDCDLAFLDINLGPNQPDGIEVYRWLRKHGFTARIFFLTGHASHYPLVLQAVQLGDAIVLRKPLPPETLIQIIDGQYEHSSVR